MNNIRRLTGDLRQDHAQLNTRHTTLRQNFDNIRNERDALRAQTNLDQQNLNILGQQNIDFQRLYIITTYHFEFSKEKGLEMYVKKLQAIP